MKKRFKIIIGCLIIIALIVIIYIVLNNIISTHNIAFPKVLTINSNSSQYYAKQKYLLWQYPDEDNEILGITSPPIITDNRVGIIKEFLKEDAFIPVSNNILTVNLDNLKNCKMEDIKDICVILYDDENVVTLKSIENIDNKITISLDKLTANTNYYGEIRITYLYNSIVEYVFKFIII